jgi:hypothetical protein
VVVDPRLMWPDTMAIGPDQYLYFTTSQRDRRTEFHNDTELGSNHMVSTVYLSVRTLRRPPLTDAWFLTGNSEVIHSPVKRVIRGSVTVVAYLRSPRSQELPHTFPILRTWVRHCAMSRMPKEVQRGDLTGFAVLVAPFWTVLDRPYRLSLML